MIRESVFVLHNLLFHELPKFSFFNYNPLIFFMFKFIKKLLEIHIALRFDLSPVFLGCRFYFMQHHANISAWWGKLYAAHAFFAILINIQI